MLHAALDAGERSGASFRSSRGKETLALASYHRCDFLVTWNCKHLANASKFGHIRRVNGLLGLFTPSLVTPLELLGDDEDED